MKRTGSTHLAKFAIIATSVMMLVAFLIPAATADAQQYQATPCPHYAIQDVFDDPNGNWDGDQVNNADELYNGLNPCIVDTGTYCAGGGNALCYYPTYTITYPNYTTECQYQVKTYPTGDYDNDGISNSTEVLNGANPCAHPCPNPTHADLALNPNGSWDNDGVSNAVEVSRGTNPCVGNDHYGSQYTNPCPNYTYHHVELMPNHDWDGDGVTNATEVYRGTNPCAAPITYVPATPRLPHVNQPVRVVTQVVYVPVTPKCPTGYPYYHTGNGLCYANPVTPYGRYIS